MVNSGCGGRRVCFYFSSLQVTLKQKLQTAWTIVDPQDVLQAISPLVKVSFLTVISHRVKFQLWINKFWAEKMRTMPHILLNRATFKMNTKKRQWSRRCKKIPNTKECEQFVMNFSHNELSISSLYFRQNYEISKSLLNYVTVASRWI